MKPLVAYLRVSTASQGKSGLGIDAQRDAIRRFAEAEGFAIAAEFVEVETGKGSDALDSRPQLAAALAEARKIRAAVVVWKLDRLSRSLKDVLHLMEEIAKVGAGFRSLTEAVDTTSPGGRMMMQIIGAFAEFERAMLRERTRNGLDAARKQGRVGGRRSKLKPQQQQEIVHLVRSGQKTAADAARLFDVHPATVSRILQRAKTNP